jgi:hypothetical protein
METTYDWVTVAIFAGLIILFLQRSTAEVPSDRIYQYAPAALGCAVANYFGNNQQSILAILLIAAVGAYVWFVLKPFKP